MKHSNKTTTRYRLKNISIKEIMDKYPDKVVGVRDRKKDSVLILDTCRIVFPKNK